MAQSALSDGVVLTLKGNGSVTIESMLMVSLCLLFIFMGNNSMNIGI